MSEPQTEGYPNCDEVAAHLYDMCPDDLPPPERIVVEQVNPSLYACRIYFSDRDYEAFFLAVQDRAWNES